MNQPTDKLTDILERTPSDCKVPFEPESLEILAQLKLSDKSRFMQVRKQIKGINKLVSLKALDKDIQIYCKKNQNKSSSTASPSLSSSCASPKPSLGKNVLHFVGALIIINGGEKPKLVTQSAAAVIIAEELKGAYAFDIGGMCWYKFVGCRWKTCPANTFDKVIMDLMYAGTAQLGFSNSLLTSIVVLLQKGGRLRLPDAKPGMIPFKNGLLDLSTKQLETATPDNVTTWVLPYDYSDMATCPNFLQWLETAVENDQDTIQLLRAWLNALLTGRPDLQIFLHMIGPGGTGKSTFGRIVFLLVGNENATTTSLYQLEKNRFETASIYGKRLVAIEDADKYGGSVSVLKSMTGQDPLRFERKGVQQQGAFIYTGQTLLMSNERLITSDHTSGIERRRVTVEFTRRFTQEDRTAWAGRGGEERILHTEAPGIIKWALELTSDEVSSIFQEMPERTRKANLAAARYNNPIIDWMLESLHPANGVATQIGNKQEIRDNGRVLFAKADEWLYPNYLQWCEQTEREKVSLQKFKSTLISAASRQGVTVTSKRECDGTKVYGLRMRLEGEETWLSAVENGTTVKDIMEDNLPELFEMNTVKDSCLPSSEQSGQPLCSERI